LFRLQGRTKDSAWGSRTAIPELLGLEPDDGPQAELWLGAHPSSPSVVEVLALCGLDFVVLDVTSKIVRAIRFSRG
jgi:mannose-6-phosphate isomerase